SRCAALDVERHQIVTRGPAVSAENGQARRALRGEGVLSGSAHPRAGRRRDDENFGGAPARALRYEPPDAAHGAAADVDHRPHDQRNELTGPANPAGYADM